MSANRPLHFLLRYSDSLSQRDTISEHLSVIRSSGEVLFGKFGVGAAAAMLEIALHQLSEGVKNKLYLMSDGNVTHQCSITKLHFSEKSCPAFIPNNSTLVPEYYRNTACKLWFQLSDIEPFTGEYSIFRLYNTPQLPPSKRGMRGLIYVTLASDVNLTANGTKTSKPPLSKLYTGGLFD